MSNPVSFINTVHAKYRAILYLDADAARQQRPTGTGPSLDHKILRDENPSNPNINVVRTDITEQDVKDAQAAIVQMMFTYDSGDPSNKSALFKMLP